MNRKIRTTLPILLKDLKPRLPDYSKLQCSEKQQRNKQKQNFDKLILLTALKEGMTVWIPDYICLGKVVTQVETRSYQLKMSYGVLRHNHCYLIASPNKHFDDEENADLESLTDLSNNDSTPDLLNNDSATSHPPEPSLHSNRNRTVYTRSGRASRPPSATL